MSYSPDDLRRIASHAILRRFDYFQRLSSTNDRALELAADDSVATPALVLVEQQNGGRGRGGNRWWAAPGALTFSMLLSPNAAELPEQRQGLVALTAGLAVCEALRELLPPTRRVGLKWPNDVLLDGRKVCGILVEVPPRRCGKIVVGIGINVNNSLADAPQEIQMLATSLCDATTDRYTPTEVLLAVLERFCDRRQSLGEDTDLSRDWQQYCLLTGRTVRLQIGSRVAVGLCEGIDREGALLLRTENGLQRHFSGVVVQYE